MSETNQLRHPGDEPHTSGDALGIVADAARQLVDNLVAIDRRSEPDADCRTAVAAAMDRLLATVAATGLWGRENEVPGSEIWRIAGHLLERGYLQLRAKQKPLGYAGDYSMMTDFWEHRVRGETPLARALDDYFQREKAVDAVRARIALAGRMISERCAQSHAAAFRVVSIGSGPAIDLLEAAQALTVEARSRLRLTLLDLDEEALSAARARLATTLDAGQIDARRENLFRLTKLRGAARTTRNPLPQEVDFILCSGLFDYLADDVAAAHLESYWNSLRSGGRLMVGNFAPENPSRAYMEWIGNWYLLYRTRDDLERLADAAGIPASSRRVIAETTGYDLFIVADKPSQCPIPSPSADIG
jgi:extracellular factor (EF) 3-hydroxypalmitic acid methyl ester biosynthesis protein